MAGASASGVQRTLTSGQTFVAVEIHDYGNDIFTVAANSTQNGMEFDLQTTIDGTTWVLVDRKTTTGSYQRWEFYPPQYFRVLIRNTATADATIVCAVAAYDFN